MRKLKLPGRTRNMPRLDQEDYRLIQDQGIQKIKKQVESMIEKKLREKPGNDGKQTPSRGNPVYKAMHACKCSSRRELKRAHRIPSDRELKDKEIKAVKNLLTRWIVREYNFFKEQRSQEVEQRKLEQF
jgi:hypothetical protein